MAPLQFGIVLYDFQLLDRDPYDWLHAATNTTFEDCPKLDAILLGGPGLDFWDNILETYVKFFHQKAEEVEYFFTTCTCGIVAGKAGLLRGRRAKGPFIRMISGLQSSRFPIAQLRSPTQPAPQPISDLNVEIHK
ncbi:hypothetical protein ETB97_004931 [Aspergillus alliaceus]|uniref:DJ-1/PfpI domain-containing protein n=1 Tax=Petromyces alliaceus TaxID=209559 RepID=A0A8H6A0W8_PETAA|nr:hypothetical protein ETB97_004931 [Aspergillus burnettii]